MSSTEQISSNLLGRFNLKAFLILLSFGGAIFIYIFIVDMYLPQANIFRSLNFTPKVYNFYSGGEKGFYYPLAKVLEQSTQNHKNIKIIAHPTAGGFENALRVMESGQSFGLVQEETIRDEDYIKKQVQYVAPIYTERLHILYRKDFFGDKEENLELSANTSKKILKKLNSAKINSGPVGSSTRIITSYLLSELLGSQLKPVNTQEIHKIKNLSNKDAFAELDKKNLDIVFVIAGAPLPDVVSLLNTKKIGLLGVSPSLVAKLNEKYRLNLRFSDFRDKYSGKNVSTIGTHAFLIASQDVPSNDIISTLEILNANEKTLRNDLGFSSSVHFQLDEFDYLSAFKSKHETRTMKKFWDISIFISSVFVITITILTFLVWIISSLAFHKHFQMLTEVISNHLPRVEKLDEETHNFSMPITPNNQSEIMSRLVRGQQKLIQLDLDIQENFRTGRLIDRHFFALTEQTERVVMRIRSSIERSLFKQQDDSTIARKLYEAGYLGTEEYDWLITQQSNQHPGSL